MRLAFKIMILYRNWCYPLINRIAQRRIKLGYCNNFHLINRFMIKYFIYNFDSEIFKEVSKDLFYSTMRLYKSTKTGFTQECVWRYTDGNIIKEKRLIGNSVYHEKVS